MIGIDNLPLGHLFETWGWLIVLALALAILREAAFRGRRRRKRKSRGDRSRKTGQGPKEAPAAGASRFGGPTAQMAFLSNVDFEPRRLLNRAEYGILRILENITREIGGGYRVMAQTSLGEIIAPRSASGSDEARDLALRSIDGERLDFLVIDRIGMPALAVEYRGHGRCRNRALMRDAVKREAVRKAGIRLLEVPAEYDARIVEDEVGSVLRPNSRCRTALDSRFARE